MKIGSETELKTQNTELEQFLGWPSVSSVYCLLWRWTNDLVFSYLPGGDQTRGAQWSTVRHCTECTAGECTANNVTLSDRQSVEPTSPPIPVI